MSDWDPERDNPIVRLHGEKLRDWKRHNALVDDNNLLRSVLFWVAIGLIAFGLAGLAGVFG